VTPDPVFDTFKSIAANDLRRWIVKAVIVTIAANLTLLTAWALCAS